MGKKILKSGGIIILLICTFYLGFITGQKDINGKDGGKTNIEITEQEENTTNEMTKDFEEAGYIFAENINVNTEDFKDICYVVTPQFSRNKINYKKGWNHL